MEILDIRILRGPNYWSINHKVVVARIDIGKFEDIPSNRIEGFHYRLQQLLPGLNEHYCSVGQPGGFLERVKNGTWIGHIVEHIALELQAMAGTPCNFGKTRGSGERGIYNVVISYEFEKAGEYAAHAAVRIAQALSDGIKYPIHEDIENLKKIVAEEKLGPSTSSIVIAAVSKGIPYIRLDNGSYVQLGYGSKQKRIEATVTDGTSCIAVDIASDKQKTKSLLAGAGIPVPRGSVIFEKHNLPEAISAVGFPVVIKPYNGNKGKGVTVNINDAGEADLAFDKAKCYSDGIIIEQYIPGDDYRMLIINYKMIAAARRTPAQVIGNDFSTIRELVMFANQNPSRGYDHENVLTRIHLDEDIEEYLNKQNITLDSVPPLGMKVTLRQTANLSQGGTADDVTDFVHPEIKAMAERAARIIGLDICGIDLIAEDITRNNETSKSVIIEINAAPGFRMHTNPVNGKPRPVGDAVIDMLFPHNADGRIPVVAITGTNGKTSTARLLAHIAKTAGYTVGLTSTEGIYIDGVLIEEGDCTGAGSAQVVLKDKSVDFAVLECARGGILKTGLGFDTCDTAILTNVAEDHLGLDGIETVEQMTAVKSVVAESVKPEGLAILNENNEYSFSLKHDLKSAVALFSINSQSQRIKKHITNGGLAAIYENNNVILINGKKVILTEPIENIPFSFGGKALFMIENILAAVLAAYYNRISIQHISEALRTFIPNYENTPGRMNLIRFKNYSLLIDYAHNVHGIEALGSYLRQISSASKIGIITAPGDRRESDIIGVGKIAAGIFDRVIIRIDEDPRDRKPVEIANLLISGIRLIKRNVIVEIIEKETDALTYACSVAEKNSMIVLLSEKIKKSYNLANELVNLEMKTDTELMPDNPYVLRVGRNNRYEYSRRKVNRI